MIRTVATAESEAHPHLHGLDTEHIHHCLERTIGNMWKDKDQLRRWKGARPRGDPRKSGRSVVLRDLTAQKLTDHWPVLTMPRLTSGNQQNPSRTPQMRKDGDLTERR